MTDNLTPEQRRRTMQRIGSRDTAPEMLVRRMLHAAGFRFRLHRRDLPGCPDIVLPKYRTVVFVHGCFWHRHAECSRGRSMPASNEEYWEKKFRANVHRDAAHRLALKNLGWKVIVVWECQVRDVDTLKRWLLPAIRGGVGESAEKSLRFLEAAEKPAPYD